MADSSHVLALAAPGLVKTDAGHSYVLSHKPGPVADALVWALNERKDDLASILPHPSGATYLAGEQAINIVGLTEDNRPEVEGVLAAALTRANIATAGITNEQLTEQIVWASFERLPASLPSR